MSDPSRSDEFRVDEQMDRVFREWFRQAEADKDERWYRENLAEEFVYLNAGGGMLDVDGILELTKSSDESHYDLEGLTARRYGEVVLVTGTYRAAVEFPADSAASAEMREKYRTGVRLMFSSTWTDRDGRLVCLHLHSTTIGD